MSLTIAKMKTWLIAASAIGGIFASDIIRLSAVILKKNMGTDSMSEYIEREAAIAKCREIVACKWNHIASPISWADAYEQFAEDIEEIQTADVAPVRHGQWEKQSGLYSCSECGRTCPYDVQADVIEYWVCNYCPNCGSKMDGDKDA